MHKSALVVMLLTLASVSCSRDGAAENDTPPVYTGEGDWKPGVTYNVSGGIPSRPVCKELTPKGSGQDDTPEIQQAIADCDPNTAVKLSAGTFRIKAGPDLGLFLAKSNMTLRGTLDASGDPATLLQCDTSISGADPKGCASLIAIGTPFFYSNFGQSVDVASDIVQGSESATVSSNPGFQKGELVMVDEETDASLTWWARRCSPECPELENGYCSEACGYCEYPYCRAWFIRQDRPIGQINEIAEVNGNTLTFSAPFHIGFRKSKNAQVTRIKHGETYLPTTGVGVEDLHVSGGAWGDSGGNVHLFAASYSWVKNVEASDSEGTNINFDGTFRCELRDSYIHTTTTPAPGGSGYGIGFNYHAADNLVENNISWNFNKVMVMRASGGGNVIGYNYMDDAWGEDYPMATEAGINASHYSGSHMELLEGNQAPNFSSDSTFGNSIYITIFRNFLTGLRGGYGGLYQSQHNGYFYEDLQNRRAVDVDVNQWWITFTGNVLGYEDQEAISDPLSQGLNYQCEGEFSYEYVDDPSRCLVTPMWKIADDEIVKGRLVRHGNFDWVTKTTKWDPTLEQTIPDSLYLTAKPAFMGDETWPWVDPLTGTTYVLPAKKRFQRLVGQPEAPSGAP